MIMAEYLFGILVVVGVVAVAAVLFVVWGIVSLARLAIWTLKGLLGTARGPMEPLRGRLTCPGAMCRAGNPPTARFCRRCGRPLGERGYGAMRRAAAW